MRNTGRAKIGWLRRLFSGAGQSEASAPGVETVVPLPEALGLLEARICEGLLHQGETPARGHGLNAFGSPVHARTGDGPGAALALGTGMALTGLRVSVFLDSDELHAVHEPMRAAATRLVPLVLHSAGWAQTGLHGVADTGFFEIAPRDAQQALDLTLVARWLTERALVPGLVATEGETVARVRMPEDDMIRALLGRPDEFAETATADQQVVFGPGRLRMVRHFDPDHPVASGQVKTDREAALAETGRELFFSAHVGRLARQAMDAVAERTGRDLDVVDRYRLDDADYVIVTSGAIAQAARAVVDHVRATKKLKVGVLGLVWLRPFPTAEVAEALLSRKAVAVIERSDDPLGASPPLFREVAASLQGKVPRLVSARLPSRAPAPALDLLSGLCEILCRRDCPASLRLDLAEVGRETGLPRRDAAIQSLLSDHPELGRDAVAPGLPPSGTPNGGSSIGVVAREAALPDDALTRWAGDLAKKSGPALTGDVLRPRPGVWEARLRASANDFEHMGPTAPVDVLVLDWRAPADLGQALDAVVDQGTVLVASGDEPEQVWASWPAAWRDQVRERGLRVFLTPADTEEWMPAAIALHGGDAGDLVELAWSDLEAPDDGEPEPPEVLRRIKKERRAPDSLPRFFGEIVQPGLAGPDPTPDPLTAYGAVPAGAAALPSSGLRPGSIPKLNNEACTGCGQCWTACPDSAIGVTALSLEGLLTAASEIAKTEGKEADALRRAHKHLAGRVAGKLAKAEAQLMPPEAIGSGWGWLAEQMSVAENERPAYEAALEATLGVVDKLEPVVTEALFHRAERAKKGSGELLVLAVDPRACQACGLCVAVCPEDALANVARDSEETKRHRERWSAWEGLPDTAGSSITAAEEALDTGVLGAVLLSRHCAQSQVGAGPDEPGSGERLAMRQVVAMVEAHGQRQLASTVQRLEEAKDSLQKRISDLLMESLAEADSNALTEALGGVLQGRVPLATLGDRLDKLGTSVTIDRRSVLRTTRLASGLAREAGRLSSGVDGLGRARFGVLVTRGAAADRLASFPRHRHFAPATVELGDDGVALAHGIAQGLVLHHIEFVRALRRVKAIAEAPTDISERLAAIDRLSWSEVTEEERAACPPLLLFGDEHALSGRGFGALTGLLASDLPIKVILLDGLGRLDDPTSSALVAMAHRKAFVLASSVAEPAHLGRGLRDALARGGTGFVHIHAPSPARHGFATDLTIEQARRAVHGRAHVLLRYDPGAEGVFGTRIDIDGNPAPDATWGDCTLASWAVEESRFADRFEALKEDDPCGLPFADLLGLPAEQRVPQHGYVERGEARLRVVPSLVRAAEERLATWKTLREIAGAESPFADRMRAALKQEVAAEQEKEVAAGRAELEAQIAELRSNYEREAVTRITDRLMTLTRHAGAGRD